MRSIFLLQNEEYNKRIDRVVRIGQYVNSIIADEYSPLSEKLPRNDCNLLSRHSISSKRRCCDAITEILGLENRLKAKRDFYLEVLQRVKKELKNG